MYYIYNTWLLYIVIQEFFFIVDYVIKECDSYHFFYYYMFESIHFVQYDFME